ncbi:MAG TPA: efflux RND transporter periplasmic adaptor subunit [Terriglobia bacterium]|nr:efflux RND transporter periplasmic adaptor subunit [Terriglobia bacterium]
MIFPKKYPGPRVLRWASLAMVPVFLVSAACSRRGEEAAESSTSYAGKESPANEAQLFSVPKDQMNHISLVQVEPSKLERVLRLSGNVTYNAFVTTPVITQVSGPISRIVAVPGQQVHAGEPLCYVSSPDFAQLRSNYLKTRSAFELADKNDTRAKDLYAHHAIAEADLQQADSARAQALADLQSAEQSLKVLGLTKLDALTDGPNSAEIPVLAPIAGEVVERLVSPGQVVQAGATQAFTISNLRTMWVLASVFERDLGVVHVGDPVTIQSDAYPDEFHGRISFVAPAVDSTTRTLQVRIVADNPRGELKKDMYVTATVVAGSIPNALTVPDSAVLRNGENQPFVFMAQGDNQFGQRLVEIGESRNGKTQILSGLKAGDRVAAEGSLFLQFSNSMQR